MALIAPARIYTDGATSKVPVYRVLGTTQADTIQLSADFTFHRQHVVEPARASRYQRQHADHPHERRLQLEQG